MENDTLKVSLIQSDLIWEQPAANRRAFEIHFNQVPSDCNLVVLPEMFTTGFTMNPDHIAETMEGETIQWLRLHAKKMDCAICGSIAITADDTFYNRFLFVRPDGSIDYYNKRHTFNMAGEGEKYQAGSEVVTIDYLGWKILPQVCYDLRFPVFSRNTVAYDLIIYVANWPMTRIAAWDTLLKARAIENMSYAIGVNRVGVDAHALTYVGHSAIYDVLGEPAHNLTDGDVPDGAHEETCVISGTLSRKRVQKMRSALPFLEDRDAFTLDR